MIIESLKYGRVRKVAEKSQQLFILGHDFMKLCDVTDVDAIHFYKLLLGTVNRPGVKLGDPSGFQLPHLSFQIRHL